MHISDFDYDFPTELIALTPAAERSASRLLCLDGNSGNIAHQSFCQIVDEITPNDLLVFNDTKVIPARLYAKKATGGQLEVLITTIQSTHQAQALVRSNKPLKLPLSIFFTDSIVGELSEKNGECVTLRLRDTSIHDLIKNQGHIPLPPYIHRPDEGIDQTRYQTVYAQHEGSIAAPTAGLHFDQPLLEKLAQRGIESATVTLQVGIGTFQPVRVTTIEEHQMHAEKIHVSQTTIEKIQATKARGGRVIAVGTTTVRSLETCAQSGNLGAFSGESALFIYPGFRFQVVDAMITNFHLPRSTLLMLVSAFAGRESVLNAYRIAIANQYRLFSYGDAMFITRRNRL